MAKILFVFGGTGQTKEELLSHYEATGKAFSEDVVRVYFNGCQDAIMGGQYFSELGRADPNLDIAAKNICKCINNQVYNPMYPSDKLHDLSLSITNLKKIFRQSIEIIGANENDAVDVESFTLMGFSRGAVTAFAVARYLNEFNKPISIFAEEPVPGNSSFGASMPESEFQKNRDLSKCSSIESVEIVIGRHRLIKNDLFHKQMVPIFADSCKLEVYTIPKRDHFTASNLSFDNFDLEFLKKIKFIQVSQPTTSNLPPNNLFFVPNSIHFSTIYGTIATNGQSKI